MDAYPYAHTGLLQRGADRAQRNPLDQRRSASDGNPFDGGNAYVRKMVCSVSNPAPDFIRLFC